MPTNFRFADHFVVLKRNQELTRMAVDMVKAFRECALNLQFTFEILTSSELQFLDLSLRFQDDHARWLSKRGPTENTLLKN